jgi:hypothetical protein
MAVVRNFTVNPASQTISFSALSSRTFGAAPFPVSATASSGLPVSFASTTGAVCTVAGSKVTIAAGGVCSITASQTGNANYTAAAAVVRSFTVNPASQTISFGTLSGRSLGMAPFTVAATVSSGLAVNFASTTMRVCMVSGNTVTLVSSGTCSIAASQAGNASYAPAATVTRSFSVNSSNGNSASSR